MTAPPIDLPDIETTARTLTATLNAAPGQLFAVLDGALFDDLPGDLLREGLSCRSLFLEHGDKEVERAGPWLIALDSEKSRVHVETFAVAQPCAVFWSCPEDDMALWRHLRTLNQILIPLEEQQPRETQETLPKTPGYERVMFRHWDPNVLAAVMPVLDAAQFARVFGPATHIAINAPDFGGLKRIPRPDNLPAAPHGPLRMRSEQMEGLKQTMMGASRARIRSYLLEVAPDESRIVGGDRLNELVVYSEQTGVHLGLESEQAHGRWAYVMVRTNGRALEQPGLKEWITDGKGHPDDKMRALLKSMAEIEKGAG